MNHINLLTGMILIALAGCGPGKSESSTIQTPNRRLLSSSVCLRCMESPEDKVEGLLEQEGFSISKDQSNFGTVLKVMMNTATSDSGALQRIILKKAGAEEYVGLFSYNKTVKGVIYLKSEPKEFLTKEADLLKDLNNKQFEKVVVIEPGLMESPETKRTVYTNGDIRMEYIYGPTLVELQFYHKSLTLNKPLFQ